MAKISKNIFREYDIRGREDSELTSESLELIGKSYGTYLAKKGVDSAVVGRDARGTSDLLEKAIIKGILSAGIDVIDIGMVLTPMLYWAQHYFNTEGGAMITASHNPKGWNGAKLASGLSSTMSGKELLGIYEAIEIGDFKEGREGSVSREDIKKAYIEDLSSKVSVTRNFKIVVNTGNGTAGPYAPDMLRTVGVEVIEHLTNPDPNYPNYTPNPSEMDMMNDTVRVVLENNADIGFAFDGDGDRLGVVDDKGEILWPDQYMVFLSRHILEKEPGASIVFDVKSSQALEEDISAHGGVPVMSRTGHSHMKSKMKEVGALLGGELSGHTFIKYNFYGFDDSLFSALMLLEYFSEHNKPVSELVAEIPKYISTPGYNASCPDDKKFEVIKSVKNEFEKDGYEIIDIDGVRVKFENGWGLARVSNTSPNITLRFEAKTQEELDKIQDIFREKLSKYPEMSDEWIPG